VEANRISRDPIQIEALRERDRRSGVQTRLRALPVVEDFDVFADCKACLLARGEAFLGRYVEHCFVRQSRICAVSIFCR